MMIARLRLCFGAGLIVAVGLTAESADTQDSKDDATSIVGTWRGTATTGKQSAEVAFDIRTLREGVGLYLTLPRLRAWRMPVDLLKPSSDGTWRIPDWHITLRRAGDKLVGELGDPRVSFEVTKAEALPAELPLPIYPPGPSPTWTYNVGAPVWASAVASDGVVYVGDAQGTMHAVSAAKGTRVWSSPMGAPMYGAALVNGNRLFVLDDNGALHLLDRRAGKEIWRVELGADKSRRVLPAAAVFTFDFHSPTPALRDGTIFIASSDGVMHAISSDTGRHVWRKELNSKIRASATVSDRHVFVGTMDNDVIALDRRTGGERWRFRTTGAITSAPTLADGLVLVASRGSWISALDADTGAEVWARYDWFSWIESTGVLVDGTFYVGSSDLRAVRAMNPRTGETIWETDVLGWAWGTPVLTGDTVYIGVAGPLKYVTKHEAGLVALDRKTGAVRWRRPIPADPTTFVSGYPGSVTVVNDTLIAPNVRGVLDGYKTR